MEARAFATEVPLEGANRGLAMKTVWNMLKKSIGILCLLIAIPAGFSGTLFLAGSIWCVVQIKKGHDYGDSMGLGLMFAICLLAVAGVLGPTGWGFLKAASMERSKERKP